MTVSSVAGKLAGMARKLRVEYPGAMYHVMNRGDRREPIFRDDEDRKLFLVADRGWKREGVFADGL